MQHHFLVPAPRAPNLPKPLGFSSIWQDGSPSRSDRRVGSPYFLIFKKFNAMNKVLLLLWVVLGVMTSQTAFAEANAYANTTLNGQSNDGISSCPNASLTLNSLTETAPGSNSWVVNLTFCADHGTLLTSVQTGNFRFIFNGSTAITAFTASIVSQTPGAGVYTGATTANQVDYTNTQDWFHYLESGVGQNFCYSVSFTVTGQPTSINLFGIEAADDLSGMAGCPLTISMASLNSNNPTCGNHTLTASGGTQYDFGSGFSSTTTYTATSTGTYTVTVQNAGGSTATSTVAVTVNPLPTASLTSNSPQCGSVILTATPYSGTDYTYAWSAGATGSGTDNTATTTTTDTYTVTVTEAATGCTATSTVTATVIPNPAATLTSNSPQCSIVTLTAEPYNGTDYTYAWSAGATGSGSDNTATITITGIYTVTVTEVATGCTATAETSSGVAPPAVLFLTSNSPQICGGVTITAYDYDPNRTAAAPTTPKFNRKEKGEKGTNTAQHRGGGTYYDFGNGFGTANTYIANSSGTYTVTIENSNYCTTSTTIDVVVTPAMVEAFAAPATFCAGEDIALTMTTNVPVGNIPYTMNSNAGIAFNDISGSGAAVAGLNDDSEHPITLPFSFNYNGTAYTEITVSSNGAIAFGNYTGISFGNIALPADITYNSSGVYAAIAAFWDDLFPDTDGTPAIYTQQIGNTFIIQWNISHIIIANNVDGLYENIVFQVVLDATTGAITLVYNDVNFGNTSHPELDGGGAATIGLNFSATSALQYSHNTASLVDGQSIQFTPVTPALSYSWEGPNSFTSTDEAPTVTGTTAASAGTYTVTVSNGIGCSETATVAVAACGISTTNPACGSNPSVLSTGSNQWLHLADAAGNRIASIYDSEAMGTVEVSYHINTGALRSDWAGVEYVDRNIAITVQNQPMAPVLVRYYFLTTEFNTFMAGNDGDANDVTAISGLVVTHIPGATCAAVSGANSTLITPTANGSFGDGSYVEFPTPSFSGFFLHGGTAALPVELLNFTGRTESSNNRLLWATATEQNTAYFVVERSANGTDFAPIGDKVLAAGNSNTNKYYELIDEKPLVKAYYRLRMVDVDGAFSYSASVLLQRKGGVGAVSIAPNPATQNAVVTYEMEAAGTVTFNLIDALGRIVQTQTTQAVAGTNQETLHLEALPSAVYSLQVLQNNTVSQIVKLTVVK